MHAHKRSYGEGKETHMFLIGFSVLDKEGATLPFPRGGGNKIKIRPNKSITKGVNRKINRMLRSGLLTKLTLLSLSGKVRTF